MAKELKLCCNSSPAEMLFCMAVIEGSVSISEIPAPKNSPVVKMITILDLHLQAEDKGVLFERLNQKYVASFYPLMKSVKDEAGRGNQNVKAFEMLISSSKELEGEADKLVVWVKSERKKMCVEKTHLEKPWVKLKQFMISGVDIKG